MKTVLCVLSFLFFTLNVHSQNNTNSLNYNESDEVYNVVEEMPRFPGCEELESQAAKQKCSNENLIEYIYSNLEYPEEARSSKIEGRAIVQFVIQKNGTLTDIKIARDPGAGLGQAALDVIHKMNTDGIVWIPGKQRNKVVKVQYTLPVLFKLENVIKP